jgi:hypothetical protein
MSGDATNLPRRVTWEVGTKKPGSVTTLLRNRMRTARTGETASVPCAGCTLCCRAPRLYATLTDEERKQFPDAVYDDGIQRWRLPKRQDGSCSYLVDNRCSAYERRPHSCRVYDCRDQILMNIAMDDDPYTLESMQQWDNLSMPTHEDRITSLAIQFAVLDGGIPADFEDAVGKLALAYSQKDTWYRCMQLAAEMFEATRHLSPEEIEDFFEVRLQARGK